MHSTRSVNTTKRSECTSHPGSGFALVCQHLGVGEDLGVVTAEQLPGEPAQSWCFACHALLVSRGMEWNPDTEAAAAPTAVCMECYEVICRRNHRTELGWLRLFGLMLAVLLVAGVLGALLIHFNS
jgi:hypothetical protein